jgi:DNA-3-methyladenine glycosylase II
MNETNIKAALDALALRDSDIASVLMKTGYPAPRIRPAGFETFLNTIVSQQISTKAAATIWQRVCALMTDITPNALLALNDKQLREAGLSQRKMEYAQGLADAIVGGQFNPDALAKLDDEQAIEEIIQIRGFGRWSAEIYLMFSLQRGDIFPADDLILLTSLQRLKRLSERPTPAAARNIIEHWAPYRSAGSLFLWHFNQYQDISSSSS